MTLNVGVPPSPPLSCGPWYIKPPLNQYFHSPSTNRFQTIENECGAKSV